MTVTTFPSLILSLAVVSFVGCMNAEQPQPAAKTSTATLTGPVEIALLGDGTRVELLNQLAAASEGVANDDANDISTIANVNNCRVTINTANSDNVVAHAAICSVADLAVMAVDARNGPMPVHREHVLFARQMDIPSILIAFTHSDAIDDPELLELEELEMRELLSAYGWNGDEAIVAFDSERARVQQAEGMLMGAHALTRFFPQAGKRAKTPPAVKSVACSVEVYALAEQEAFPLRTTGISSGDYVVVLGKSTPTVTLRSTSAIRPGETGAASLTFHSALSIHSGQRCAIVAADHVAAVGVITSTEP
jgi:hypothetical protein